MTTRVSSLYNFSVDDLTRLELMNLKQMYASIYEEACKTNSIPDDAIVATWAKDKDGIVLDVSPSYEKYFLLNRGYTALDYIGKDDLACWPADLAASFRQRDLHVMQTGRPWIGRAQILNGLKDELWFVVKLSYDGIVNGKQAAVAGFAFPPLKQ